MDINIRVYTICAAVFLLVTGYGLQGMAADCNIKRDLIVGAAETLVLAGTVGGVARGVNVLWRDLFASANSPASMIPLYLAGFAALGYVGWMSFFNASKYTYYSVYFDQNKSKNTRRQCATFATVSAATAIGSLSALEYLLYSEL